MAPDAATTARELVELVNAGDTTGFLALFGADGFVDDWGRTFTGTRQIRAWSDNEFIGAHGRLSDPTIEATATEATIVAQWTSTRHNGPSRFVLRTGGGHLLSMTITEA